MTTWMWTRSLVLPFAEPLPARRSAAITPRDTSVPGSTLAFGVPVLVVLLMR